VLTSSRTIGNVSLTVVVSLPTRDFSAHFEPNDWERRRNGDGRALGADFSAHFEPNDWELRLCALNKADLLTCITLFVAQSAAGARTFLWIA